MRVHTYARRIIAGLESFGYKPVASTSSKYLAFQHPTTKRMKFVGPNGALRAGRCATQSFSLGCPMHSSESYQQYLAAGDAAIAKREPVKPDASYLAKLAMEP